MSNSSPLSSTAIDDSLAVLAHEQCRLVLYYFARYTTEVATIDDLADFIHDQPQHESGTNAHENALTSCDTPAIG